MTDFSPSRRRLFTAAGGLALAGLASPVLSAAAAACGPSRIVAAAQAGLARHGARIAHQDVVGVADFSQPSARPRLHLVDMRTGQTTSLLVAHGRGSDPAHSGWLTRFSNAPGSDCTSDGAYLTADYYAGKHGRSMRLAGLDPTNDNAMSRAIVVHAAPYVSPAIAKASGVLGRSEGCFALSDADLPYVLERLGPGRLLVAAKL